MHCLFHRLQKILTSSFICKTLLHKELLYDDSHLLKKLIHDHIKPRLNNNSINYTNHYTKPPLPGLTLTLKSGLGLELKRVQKRYGDSWDYNGYYRVVWVGRCALYKSKASSEHYRWVHSTGGIWKLFCPEVSVIY